MAEAMPLQNQHFRSDLLSGETRKIGCRAQRDCAGAGLPAARVSCLVRRRRL